MKKGNKNILTIDHDRWAEFADKLEVKMRAVRCDGTTNKTAARAVLAEHFPEIDVDATMRYFEDCGGFCDCNIVMNVTLY